VPLVLFHQFKFFLIFILLAISLSQYIEALRVGFLFTFLAPLIFVLVLTMAKEAYDDFKKIPERQSFESKDLYESLDKRHIIQFKPSRKILE